MQINGTERNVLLLRRCEIYTCHIKEVNVGAGSYSAERAESKVEAKSESEAKPKEERSRSEKQSRSEEGDRSEEHTKITRSFATKMTLRTAVKASMRTTGTCSAANTSYIYSCSRVTPIVLQL